MGQKNIRLRKLYAECAGAMFNTVLDVYDDFGRPSELEDIREFVREVSEIVNEYVNDTVVFHVNGFGAGEYSGLSREDIVKAVSEGSINGCVLALHQRGIGVQLALENRGRVSFPADRSGARAAILEYIYDGDDVGRMGRAQKFYEMVLGQLSGWDEKTVNDITLGMSEGLKEAGITL